jgi:phenylacetate-CoA ligase
VRDHRTVTIFSRVLESAFIPAYYGLRRRKYATYRGFLEKSQWWTSEQTRQFQWQALQRLLEHTFRTVPYYKKKYAAEGIALSDIRTISDFAKLPPLSRAEVNSHRDELCSEITTSKLIQHATGGSSGVPTRFVITMDSYDWRCAASDRAYSWSGHRLGQRTLYLWGAPLGNISRLKSTKVAAHRMLRRELFVPTFIQTPELWHQTSKRALQFRPRFIVGYVSSIEQFASFLISEKLTLPGIQAVISAAEPVHEKTRQLVMQAFGAPLYNAYGSREFMSIAAECDQHRGLHINAENILVETELARSEGPSELLVTDLHNFGMPFIRYRIGDVGAIDESMCSCGRGLPLISSVEGRVLEVLRTSSGRIVPGEFFPHLFKDFREIREFQVQQTSLDEIMVYVVLNVQILDSSQKLIQQEIARVFGTEVRVAVTPVAAIPQLPSGKRRVTVGLGLSR